MQTAAPASESACAIAAPMPLPAPVTIATLPVRFISAPSLAADDEVGDEAGPAGLVRRAETGPGVAVEVLVKQDRVAPGRILLEQRVPAEHGTTSVGAAQEQRDEPRRELGVDLGERQLLAGPSRALDREGRAEVAVVRPQRIDQQVVDGEPHRAAPVRVAAE